MLSFNYTYFLEGNNHFKWVVGLGGFGSRAIPLSPFLVATIKRSYLTRYRLFVGVGK